MNDTELDRLLDTWEAPAPPASLREGLRARFPRAERRSFARPLRWGLAIAAASATLAVGLGQIDANPWDIRLGGVLNHIYEQIVQGFEAHRAGYILKRIRQSEPKVYVDGQQIAAPEYGHAGIMIVEVPGEGLYAVTWFAGLTGWVEAGRIHGNTIEFQAGGRQVRIECNRPIFDSDRPVFVQRRQ